MKSKLYILAFLYFFTVIASEAEVVTEMTTFFLTPRGRPLHLMRATTFIGMSDSFMQYHNTNADIDDGVFVAIPRKNGKYHGYDYYELVFNYSGCIDGGFAQLPTNPGVFREQLEKINKVKHPPYTYDAPVGSNLCPITPTNTFNGQVTYFEATMDRLRRQRTIPALKDGAIIPPDSLFFWWVSGGGRYRLSSSFLNKNPFSKPVTIEAKNVPDPDSKWELLWYEPSETVTATIDFCEYTHDEMIEKALGN